MQARFDTARLIIREPQKADAADLFQNYTQDPDVVKYLIWKPHQNIAETIRWVDFCIQTADTPDRLISIIYHKADQQAIGMIDFRLDCFKASFGYVLARKYWNQGIMTEAMRPVIDMVYQMEPIYRIWAVHDVDNEASGKVMMKLGLSFEGILRRYSIHPNVSAEPRNAKMYALVK